MIQALPIISDSVAFNLPITVGAGGFYAGPVATLSDSVTLPLFPVQAGVLPVFANSARRFGSSFLIWSELTAAGPYGTVIRGHKGKMPDESEPTRRRPADDPDSRDVPGEGGRTGPNHRSPNYDSPGSGSGGEPGLGGGAGGNVPI